MSSLLCERYTSVAARVCVCVFRASGPNEPSNGGSPFGLVVRLYAHTIQHIVKEASAVQPCPNVQVRQNAVESVGEGEGEGEDGGGGQPPVPPSARSAVRARSGHLACSSVHGL